MEKIILVAKSTNNVIGAGGKLPWKLPADVRYYHNTVRGHWALIGRKAYEAEPVEPPVAGFFILTHQEDYPAGPHKVVHDIEEGIARAKAAGRKKLFILGGGKVYTQALPLVDRLLITEVKHEFEGDTFFPEIDRDVWKEIWREVHVADSENPYPFAFTEWRRKE